MVLVLSDEDVRSLLDMKTCIECVEDAYLELAVGRGVNAPRRETFIPNRDNDRYYVFKSMEGAVAKLGVIAQRINSDLLTWPVVDGIRRRVKVPMAPGKRYVGLVFLYSTESLELLAIMNDGELQRMRVAATSGVGANYLAPKDSTSLALFGTGWQAETELIAMCTVRDIKNVKVFSPTPAHRTNFAEIAGAKLGADVTPVEDPREAVKDADIVNTATNSESNVCRGEWLQGGAHLSCIRPTEFDAQAWDRADFIVYTELPGVIMRYGIENSARSPLFKEDSLYRLGARDGDRFFKPYRGKMYPLTELLLKRSPNRTSDEDITLMYKGIGLGIEFAATAKKVYDIALREGRGQEIPSEWFTQTSHP